MEKDNMDKGKMMISKMIAVMLMSNTFARIAHLKTPSYAKHKALNEFYDEIVELQDRFAEVAQGMFGKLDIEYVKMVGNTEDPVDGLAKHLELLHGYAKGCENGALRAIYDEVEALYKETNYLMKELN